MVFSYLESLEPTTWQGRLMTRSLKRHGEPFRWAVQRAQLGAFVEGCGVSLVDSPSAEELLSRYMSEGLAGGAPGIPERIGVVENCLM